ncbi:DUF6121 family protein [Agromyces endophyticus]|uniref:DUF6121 family protein n=1 Tax=Agromyces sp. H17E-10 TaxID=2932244 RepID=UPI001FCFD862|nr:DUF6121 family protein [Agromyces sp. H17E-10]UOQ88246.1 DUF6121 family protein [Agromyces sp. H17E-10]
MADDELRTRNAWVVASFAAALDLALVVCGFGFVSLLADVEVVGDPAVGAFVAPAAVAASVAAVFVTLGVRLRHPERMTLTVLVAAVGAWLAFVVVATAGRLLGSADAPGESLRFGLVLGLGWFGLLVPVCAFVTAAFAVLVARGRQGGMERPRWPWEHDDER